MKKIVLAVLLVLSLVLIISCVPVEEIGTELEETAEEVEETAEEAEEEVEETELEAEEDAEDELVYASSGDIDILGYDGFNVEAYELSVGESVTFVNMNSEDDPISDVTITFQSQANTRQFETSSVIKLGESYTHTFTEAGEFIAWTVGYGVELPITVTE